MAWPNMHIETPISWPKLEERRKSLEQRIRQYSEEVLQNGALFIHCSVHDVSQTRNRNFVWTTIRTECNLGKPHAE